MLKFWKASVVSVNLEGTVKTNEFELMNSL